MRTAEAPTRGDGGTHDDYTESHPAYAVIGASRVHGSPGAVLFGSDFRHQSYIVIRIAKAELRRGLSRDWVHGREQLMEVALSEAQWATFLSTLNVGEGTPTTLRWTPGGDVPAIIPTTNRRDQYNGEVDDRLTHALDLIHEASAAAPTKKMKAQLDKAAQELESNLDFVARSFDEHAERTVEKAKVEVAAYISGAIQRAGIAAIAGSDPVLELAEGEAGNATR